MSLTSMVAIPISRAGFKFSPMSSRKITWSRSQTKGFRDAKGAWAYRHPWVPTSPPIVGCLAPQAWALELPKEESLQPLWAPLPPASWKL